MDKSVYNEADIQLDQFCAGQLDKNNDGLTGMSKQSQLSPRKQIYTVYNIHQYAPYVLIKDRKILGTKGVIFCKK